MNKTYKLEFYRIDTNGVKLINVQTEVHAENRKEALKIVSDLRGFLSKPKKNYLFTLKLKKKVKKVKSIESIINDLDLPFFTIKTK